MDTVYSPGTLIAVCEVTSATPSVSSETCTPIFCPSGEVTFRAWLSVEMSISDENVMRKSGSLPVRFTVFSMFSTLGAVRSTVNSTESLKFVSSTLPSVDRTASERTTR